MSPPYSTAALSPLFASSAPARDANLATSCARSAGVGRRTRRRTIVAPAPSAAPRRAAATMPYAAPPARPLPSRPSSRTTARFEPRARGALARLLVPRDPFDRRVGLVVVAIITLSRRFSCTVGVCAGRFAERRRTFLHTSHERCGRDERTLGFFLSDLQQCVELVQTGFRLAHRALHDAVGGIDRCLHVAERGPQ